MAENRKGDVVKISGEQLDENGERMMRLSAEWYGFDNASANAATMDLVAGVMEKADGWRQLKAEGIPLTEAKPKNPGAIR